MNPPDVSVVIPAYNAAATLPRAIASVLAQSYPAREVIIVDDGGTDDLTEIRIGFADRVTWIRQPNGGAASARNCGIDAASGELIAFLDADDYWEPTKLRRQVECFVRHPEIGVCGARYFEQPPGESRRLARAGIGRFPEYDRPMALSGGDAFDAACCLWTGTVVVRRRLTDEVRFESGLEPAEDRDVWIRLVRSWPMVHLSEPLATAVLEPGSLSRTGVDRDCGNMLRIVERSSDQLGSRGRRRWRGRVLRRWAAEYLGRGEPWSALLPATRRLGVEPWSPQAWWIASKCLWLGVVSHAGIPPASRDWPRVSSGQRDQSR